VTQNERRDDSRAINGELVSLDPGRMPDQELQVVSGWNNPFAFTILGDGATALGDGGVVCAADDGLRIVTP